MNKTSLRNLVILLGSTTTVLAATIISPALPDMTVAFQEVPNADFLVRLTLTMPALIIAMGAPLAGLLLDKWGRKPVLMVSLLLYGLAGTAGFFLNSLTAILLSRALLGLAVAGIMSGFTTLILDFFDGENLSRFLGYQGAFIGLGGMIFLMMAGLLADIGWRFPFLVHLFALVILPGVFWFIEEPARQNVKAANDHAEKPAFPLKTIAPIYLISFVGMVIFFIFPVQIPFHMATQPGISNSQVGFALSLQTLSSVVIALQYQRIKARFSFLAIFGMVFLTFGVNHLVAAGTAVYMSTIIALLIGGLGIGLFPPNSNVWLASVISPSLRGRAVGGMTSAIFLGQFFSPILTQPIVNRAGLSGMFAVAGIASLLLAGLFVGLAIQRSTGLGKGHSVSQS